MPKRFLAIAAALLLWSSLAFARLDINTATAEQLDGLKGIGPVKARAIVAYRRQHGPFRAVDELQNVPGLGPAIVNGFRREVTVAGPGMAAPSERPAPARPVLPAPARPAMPAQPARPAGPPAKPAVPAQPVARPASPASMPPLAAPARPAMPPRPAQPAAVN